MNRDYVRYWLLATLGGNNKFNYSNLLFILAKCRVSNLDNVGKYLSDEIKRALDYGLIRQSESYSNKKNPHIYYSITERGGDALECFKYSRYHNTKEAYKLDNSTQEVQLQMGLSQNVGGAQHRRRNRKQKVTHRKI